MNSISSLFHLSWRLFAVLDFYNLKALLYFRIIRFPVFWGQAHFSLLSIIFVNITVLTFSSGVTRAKFVLTSVSLVNFWEAVAFITNSIIERIQVSALIVICRVKRIAKLRIVSMGLKNFDSLISVWYEGDVHALLLISELNFCILSMV